MNNTAALIFPHNLYENNPSFEGASKLIIWEADLYFDQFKFHKKKLVLHRASMKYYQELLSDNYDVEYLNNDDYPNMESVFNYLNNYDQINYVDSDDYLIEKYLNKYSIKFSIKLKKYSSPNFYLNKEEINNYSGKYFMASFYQDQRKKYNYLIDSGKPFGGKWSFDEENRKKLPRNIIIPNREKYSNNKYVEEAINYVNKNYNNNYGLIETFNYPTTHKEARDSFELFLKTRFNYFGDYEDAIHHNHVYLFHSVLTPSLNIGLLNPQYIVDRATEYAHENNISLNSLEGFIRQIIGWREFMRLVYTKEGVRQRNSNHWKFKNDLPLEFWNASTGLDPVDDSIIKVLDNAYVHHIERLMVLGNIMMLLEIHPHKVYNWFMELFIDAYDWVMVPNVYGMSQNSDGGLITTKPYISGSNYILKMSNYKKSEWSEIWDGLYWRFIYKHKEQFKKNQRMSMMANLVDKMDENKLKQHLNISEKYMAELL